MLRYTASAENDLLETWFYIAEDNLGAADRVVDTIDRVLELGPACIIAPFPVKRLPACPFRET